jgi:hypothetical protein
LAGERAAFRAALHAALVRLACGGPGAALAPAVTALLAAHLGCHAVGPPARRAWLAGALDDVVDALEAAGPDGARTAAPRDRHDSASRTCAVAAQREAGRAVRVAVRLRDVRPAGEYALHAVLRARGRLVRPARDRLALLRLRACSARAIMTPCIPGTLVRVKQGALHAGTAAAAAAAAGLARLALELQAAGGPVRPALRALRRLAAAFAGALAPHAPALALLAARAAGPDELGGALALLAREAARPRGGFTGAQAGAREQSIFVLQYSQLSVHLLGVKAAGSPVFWHCIAWRPVAGPL